MQYDVLVSYNINITDSEKKIRGRQCIRYGTLQHKQLKRIRLLYDDNCIDHKIITKIRIRIRVRIIKVILVQYTYANTYTGVLTYIHSWKHTQHSTVPTHYMCLIIVE